MTLRLMGYLFILVGLPLTLFFCFAGLACVAVGAVLVMAGQPRRWTCADVGPAFSLDGPPELPLSFQSSRPWSAAEGRHGGL